jgi:hypothetical protein
MAVAKRELMEKRNSFWPVFLGAALFVAGTSFAQASTVTLEWEPSPDPDVVGYRLYYGTASGNLSNLIDTGSFTRGTVSNLMAGVTYYFAVTAYDAAGLESLPSDEISYTVPAAELEIFADPLSQTAGRGGSVALTVGAVGTGPLTYQWHMDGVVIPAGTGASYTIGNLSPIHVGLYTVTVSDGTDSLTSEAASVSIVQMGGPALIVINGVPGTHYHIRYKDEISSPIWTELEEIVLSQIPYEFLDSSALNLTRRFYHVLPVQ